MMTIALFILSILQSFVLLALYFKQCSLYKTYKKDRDYYISLGEYCINSHGANLRTLRLYLVAYMDQAVKEERYETANYFKNEIAKIDTLIEISEYKSK